MDHSINSSLLGGAFLMALLGSLHCLGMCGGIAILHARRSKDVFRYQGGRLLGYLVLGSFCGVLGEQALKWAQDKPLLKVVLFLIFALLFIVQALQWWRGMPDQNFFNFRLIHEWRKKFFKGGSFFVGLGTALLPCGWLASFGVLAASTGSWMMGALIFLMLWLGSFPILFLAGWFFSRFKEKWDGRWVRVGMSLLVLSAGFFSLYTHWVQPHWIHMLH